jgi:hypothetical protein
VVEGGRIESKMKIKIKKVSKSKIKIKIRTPVNAGYGKTLPGGGRRGWEDGGREPFQSQMRSLPRSGKG